MATFWELKHWAEGEEKRTLAPLNNLASGKGNSNEDVIHSLCIGFGKCPQMNDSSQDDCKMCMRFMVGPTFQKVCSDGYLRNAVLQIPLISIYSTSRAGWSEEGRVFPKLVYGYLCDCSH